MWHLVRAIAGVLADVVRLGVLYFRSSSSIRAENLVLRRQLARYVERGIRPRRVDHPTRVSLAVFSRLCDWRTTVVNVRPSTMIRWHRLGWRIFWRLKCKAGRPPIPLELRMLIRRMAGENPLWGQERIANELLLKLGIRVSPRTVARYMPRPQPGHPRCDQRWSTFLRNHAKAILACDVFVAVTATFRTLYLFVVIEHGTRRLAHVNVTAHPTADWTLQQLREVVGDEGVHRYLIHDRDRIFAKHLDDSIRALGIDVLRSPVASPKANAICERVIGTIRRECLDWLISISEAHLRTILKEWVARYNGGRCHGALGPGVPDPPRELALVSKSESRHRLAAGAIVLAKSILGGLHHEYSRVTAPVSACAQCEKHVETGSACVIAEHRIIADHRAFCLCKMKLDSFAHTFDGQVL
jgi:putative transposase